VVDVERRESGGVSIINLRTEGKWFWPAFSSAPEGDEIGGNEWNLSLSGDVPLRLKAELGLGLIEMDLSELDLDELQVEVAVGRAEIVLPADGFFQARVSAAIGVTEVIVPRDLPLRITLDTALTAREVEGLRGEGNVYFSPAWKGTQGAAELEISQAMGLVVVRLE
jgi:hypothetical protein